VKVAPGSTSSVLNGELIYGPIMEPHDPNIPSIRKLQRDLQRGIGAVLSAELFHHYKPDPEPRLCSAASPLRW